MGIHWQSPTYMLGGLIVGAFFALGHHLFYASLDNTPVTHGTVFSSSISKQEFNVSIGLAFAFVVKACLVFSMSVAFVQLFWREVKAPMPGKAPTLSRLDTLHGASSNIWALVDVRVWLAAPLPFLIAGLAWLVPIASIISPATLSIRMAAVSPPPEQTLQVPNLDFGTMNFLAPMPAAQTFATPGTPEDMGSYLYNGPSQSVLEISNAVMAGNEILQIKPPAPNSSWVVDFVGPSVKCHPVENWMHQLFRKNIYAGMKVLDGANLYGYLGWFPSIGWVGDEMASSLPFMSQSPNETLEFSPGDYAGQANENVTFYLAALPTTFGATGEDVVHAFGAGEKHGTDAPSWMDGTVVECVLYNSTYQASFNYLNGDQTITLNVSTGAEAVSQGSLLGPNPDNPSKDPCSSERNDSLTEDQRADCYNNRDALQALSYIAMMDAFGGILKGSVSVSGLQQLTRNSTILSTSLLNIQDLSFLRKAAAVQLGNNTLQAMVTSSAEQNSIGLVNSKDDISTQSLPDAIEEMFQRMTISLMSSASLQPNYTSTTAPAPVKVTLPAYRNIYTYSALKLWATYGVAIFLASLSVLLGLVAIFLNGASYSGNFSTIFLASRGSQLSEKVRQEDVGAEDPLPKYLSKAQVSFDSNPGGKEGGYGRYQGR